MSLGTLYGTYEIRALTPQALIKHYGLDVAVKSKDEPEFSTSFPLGLRPGFICPDGRKLTQSIAITLHLVFLSKNKELLGDSEEDYAEILEWMTFTNIETLPSSIIVFDPFLDKLEYPEEVVDLHKGKVRKYMLEYETRLKDHDYLVGDKFTLADLYAVSLLVLTYRFVLDDTWKQSLPHTTAWFRKVLLMPILQDVIGALRS